jgi:SAM-dependent methyltransferase
MTPDTPAAAAPDAVREQVRSRYGAIAAAVARTAEAAEAAPAGSSCSSCCGDADESADGADPISSKLYGEAELADLPSAAVLASLGCGNPTALAELRPGEVVLDLGSGGGIDVLLSARRVGPTGFAYGLDMTDEMLALAERNAAEHGVANVRFLKGEIEAIPLPDRSVDVVISNCVINLSTDKPRVLREAFRVLKPGGRFAVSDVVVQGDLPAPLRQSMELWAGCIAGALEERTYRRLLAEAGFEGVDVEVTRVYGADAVAADGVGDDTGGGSGCGPSGQAPAQQTAFDEFTAAGGRLVSAFVRATKPRG